MMTKLKSAASKFGSQRLVLANIGVIAAVYLVYELLCVSLKAAGYALNNLPVKVFIVILAVLCAVLLLQIITCCLRLITAKNHSVAVRILGAFGAISVLLCGVFLSIYGMFVNAFSFEPEHITSVNGEKSVAYVSAFLQVTVRYYKYENALVHHDKTILYEDYGDGGYDPFTSEFECQPKSQIYYDDNGNPQ